MPAPKFNFIPEHQLGSSADSAGFTVRLAKTGVLIISKFNAEIYKLANAPVMFFADIEKKAIGFKIMTGKNLDSSDVVRILKPVLKTGTIQTSIKKLLKSIGELVPEKSKTFDVKEYESPLIDGKIYYIEF